MNPLHDLHNEADVEALINRFYEKAVTDEVIGYIFTDVAKTDFSKHLPVMYAFWKFLLLNAADTYRGNPLHKHMELHQKHPLTAAHFDRWVALFTETVDSLFAGPVAESAKFRAMSIAETWKYKFDSPFAV